MTSIITGAFGFTGRHLAESLEGEKIYLTRSHKKIKEPKKNIIQSDLLDVNFVNTLIDKYKPNNIYHLAGSFTQNYEKDFAANVLATKNILDAVKEFSPSSRVLLVGSAAEYGIVKLQDCPISENARLNPFNIYGLTKIYQKNLMDFYVNLYALDIVMARPFNLYGKGASSLLFIGNLYKQINLYKSGKLSEIFLGNLEAKRDYILIKDAVKHYIKIMESGISGEVYNVASGKLISIKDLLKKILDEEGLDMSIIKSNSRPIQANDSSVIFADISKLNGLYDDK